MRTWVLGVLAAAVCLLAGCMKVHIETDIAKDGSGTATLTYAMVREVADAISAMEAAGSAGAEVDMPRLGDLTRDSLAASCRRAGVNLLEHRHTDDAAGVTLSFKVAFDDVEDLSRLLASFDGDDDDGELEGWRIEPLGDGNYALRTVTLPPAAAAEPADDDEAADLDELDELAEMDDLDEMSDLAAAFQHMAVLMSNIDKLDIRMAITVPGDVIHSNAMEVEGRTSIWTINAANMMQADEAALDPEIRFSGKGLKLKSPR